MSMTDREKFIYHAATLFTLQLMQKHKSNLSKKSMTDLLNLIKKNRCRKLKSDDFKQVLDDMEEEIILSSVVYDMKEERIFR